MTGPEILKAMDNGSTLHGGRFGFWLMDVFNSRCTNVHNGAARSLARKSLIKKVDDTQYIKTMNKNETPKTDGMNDDPYVIENAKAVINTLVRENERLRSARAKAENAECLLDLKLVMIEQDIETIRKIIAKGGTTADVLKFLDTPNA